MSLTRLVSTAAASAALLVTPALAVAAGPPSDPGNGHKAAGTPAPPTSPSTSHPTAGNNPGTAGRSATPGPNASADAKAKAYGKSCQGQSKKHVKGEKGTAFSRCVTAMAKVAAGTTSSPRTACAGLSKKHVKGEKGTAFSRCVVAAAKLKKDQQDANDATDAPSTPDTTTTTPPADATPAA